MDTLPITTPRQAGIYVRQAREAQGITRATLAKKAGVSERLLASLELGDATGIRLDKLLKVFDALGLTLAAQGDITETGSEQSVNAPHADQEPRSAPKRHHAQRPQHSKRRSAVIPALEDAPLRPSLRQSLRRFRHVQSRNLDCHKRICQAKPEGNTSEHYEH